ncbi:hypothetical protein [Streptomyces sp. NPDC053079]|uniref:hypothetical protein n=1 Tax=Streptomyces sp. NPDC053079 TaxID=3365697 RepID=UPI0037D1857D
MGGDEGGGLFPELTELGPLSEHEWEALRSLNRAYVDLRQEWESACAAQAPSRRDSRLPSADGLGQSPGGALQGAAGGLTQQKEGGGHGGQVGRRLCWDLR